MPRKNGRPSARRDRRRRGTRAPPRATPGRRGTQPRAVRRIRRRARARARPRRPLPRAPGRECHRTRAGWTRRSGTNAARSWQGHGTILRFTQHAREYAVAVDIERIAARPTTEPAELLDFGDVRARFHRAEVLPTVDHVVFHAFACAFAHQHRPVVRPLFEPLRHQRDLHARQVDGTRFLADARAAAAADLESEAAAGSRFEPERLEAP